MKSTTTELTYRQLQTALKPYKSAGFTNVKLNSKKEILVAEYNRLTAGALTLVTPEQATEETAELTDEPTPVTLEKTYEDLDKETYNLVVEIAMERGYARSEAESFANQLRVVAKKDYSVAYDKFLTRLMS